MYVYACVYMCMYACTHVHTYTCTHLHIILQYCWKLLHPTNEYDNKECPKEAEAYEKVRTHNVFHKIHCKYTESVLC